MITVTFGGQSFKCTTALKGTDYIHLLDSNNKMIVSFDGITSFSGFTISGGSWTTPTTPDNCYVATIGDDGVLRKGSHTCSDIPTASDKANWNGKEAGGTASTKLNRTSNVNVADTNYSTVMARGISAGTTDLTPGTSSLTSGVIYLVYE